MNPNRRARPESKPHRTAKRRTATADPEKPVTAKPSAQTKPAAATKRSAQAKPATVPDRSAEPKPKVPRQQHSAAAPATDRGAREELDRALDDWNESDEIRREVEDEFEEAQDLGMGAEREARWRNVHTSESPAISGGDVDADWERADVGDETVGGSTSTPDQDVVDELGEAVGVSYFDNEPLDPEEKILRRDRERWELNPASSERSEDRREQQEELQRREADPEPSQGEAGAVEPREQKSGPAATKPRASRPAPGARTRSREARPDTETTKRPKAR
jgi:hypothetical protein